MKVTGEDLRAAWRQDSPGVDRGASTCLSELDWARLLSRQATEDERVRATEHIGTCATCADELRLLSRLDSWEAELARVLPQEDATRSRMDVGFMRWLAPRRLAWLGAAVVLLSLAALPLSLLVDARRERARLAAQVTQQQQALDSTRASLAAVERELTRRPPGASANALTAPHLAVPVLDLDPKGAGTVRGATPPNVTRVDAAAPLAMLILNFTPLPRRSMIEAQLVDDKGQERWVGRSEHEPLAASVTLAVPIARYAPGRYEIRLFDVTRARAPVGTYLLVIGSASRKEP